MSALQEIPPHIEERFDDYLKIWTEVGHKTGRINFEKVTTIIRDLYLSVSEDPPTYYLYAESPVAALYTAGFFEYLQSKTNYKVDTPDIHTKVFKVVSKYKNCYADIKNIKKLKPSNKPRTIEQHYKNYLLSKPSLSQYTENVFFGVHEAGWTAFVDIVMDIDRDEGSQFKLENFESCRLLVELTKESGWINSGSNFVVIQDFPKEYHSENGITHNENGPAVSWHDDIVKIYVYEGNIVPEYVIESKPTVDLIKEEGNAEYRRILRQRFGEGRYLAETGAKIIDVDFEGARKGAAPRMLLEDNEGRRFLVGTDGSTGRKYYMEVEDTMETCKDSHSSLCGFDEALIINKS